MRKLQLLILILLIYCNPIFGQNTPVNPNFSHMNVQAPGGAPIQPQPIIGMAFSGSGLNGVTMGTAYNKLSYAVFVVTVASNGTPDKVNWTETGGSGSSGSNVNITGGAMTLADAVTITFSATVGHHVGDSWTATVIPSVNYYWKDDGTEQALWSNGITVAMTGAGGAISPDPTFNTVTITPSSLAPGANALTINFPAASTGTAIYTKDKNGNDGWYIDSVGQSWASAYNSLGYYDVVDYNAQGKNGKTKSFLEFYTFASVPAGKVDKDGIATFPGFVGPLTGNVTGNVSGSAGSATLVATTAVSNSATYFPLFVASSTNGNQAADLGTALTYNPSTKTFSASIFSMNGSTSGTVSLAAPAIAGTQAYVMPVAYPGVSGYALTATTGGVMSWAAISSFDPASPGAIGGTTPAAGSWTIGNWNSAHTTIDANGVLTVDTQTGGLYGLTVSRSGATQFRVIADSGQVTTNGSVQFLAFGNFVGVNAGARFTFNNGNIDVGVDTSITTSQTTKPTIATAGTSATVTNGSTDSDGEISIVGAAFTGDTTITYNLTHASAAKSITLTPSDSAADAISLPLADSSKSTTAHWVVTLTALTGTATYYYHVNF